MAKKVTTTTTTVVTEEIVENELTEIIAILDRSGSMKHILDDMIGGFNTFLEDQKKIEGNCNITVVLFDDLYEVLHDNVDIKKINPITNRNWTARGMTSLNDAIGKTIATVQDRHLKSKDKPAKVLVCVVTDGQENSSRVYKREDIKLLISAKEKDNWSFLYLAANQDAFGVGDTMGFKGGNTINFNANAAGSQFVNTTLSNSAKLYRSVSTKSANYSAVVDNIVANSSNENLINNVTGDVNNPNKIIKTTQTGTYEPEADISGGTIPTLDYTKDK